MLFDRFGNINDQIVYGKVCKILIVFIFVFLIPNTTLASEKYSLYKVDSQTRKLFEAAAVKTEDMLAYVGFSIMRLLNMDTMAASQDQLLKEIDKEKNNKSSKVILNIKPMPLTWELKERVPNEESTVNIKAKKIAQATPIKSVDSRITRPKVVKVVEIRSTPEPNWVPVALRVLTKEYDKRLEALRQYYDRELNNLRLNNNIQHVVVRNDNVSLSQRIDKLDGVNLIKPNIQGGFGTLDSVNIGKLTVSDSLILTGSLQDSTGSLGNNNQILTSTGTTTVWADLSSFSLGSIDQHSDVDVSSNPPSIGQVLSWDGTNWVPATSTSPNIYTSDGSLNSDRTVTLGSHSLNFGNKLFIDSANTRVGIGTSSPNATLTLSDNGTVYDFYTNTIGGGGPEFEMTGPADQQTSFAFRYQGNGSAAIRFTKYADTQKNWAIGIQDNDNAFRIKQGWGGNTWLSSYQNEYFTILPNGNIGISNSNPIAKLDVNGTLNVTGTSTLATSTVAGDLEVGNTALFVDSLNSKVAVATSTTSQALTVNGSIDVLGTSTLLYKDGVDTLRINSTSQSLSFGTNNSNVDTHNFSTFIGMDAAPYLQNGATSNTAIGYGTLKYAQSFNTAVGYNAVRGGSFNTGVGVNAYTSGSGTYNTALGVAALRASYGSYNTALGAEALGNLQNGNDNIAIGYQAAKFISDGVTFNQNSSQSIYIGNSIKAGADNTDNEIVIGYGATGLGSNTVLIGNDNILTTVLKGNVGIGTNTPITRLDVQDNGSGTVQVIRMRAPNATYTQYSLGASDSEKVDVVWDNSIKQGRINTFNTQHTLAFNNGVLFVSSKTGSTKGIGINTGVTPTLAGPLDVRSGSGLSILTALDNGMVGIGTNAPQARLHIEGGEAWVFNSGNNPRIIIGDNTATGQYGWLQWDSTNDYFRIDTSNAAATGLKLKDNTLAIGNVFPDTTKLFIAADSANTKFVINKTGEVGIGTNTPNQKLHIDGGRLKIVNSGDLSSAGVNSGLEMGYFTGNYGYIQTYNSVPLKINTLGNDVLFDGGGKVGIGTTSPAAKLQVNGGTLSVTNSGTSINGGGNGIEIGSINAYSFIQSYQSKTLQINPLGNNIVLNPNGGKVGVGTENPQSKLHVVTVAGESNVIIERNEDSTVGAALTYQRSRGTETAKAALQSGDVIGGFNSFGYDGSVYRRSASVRTFVDGAVSSGVVPGRIVFETMDSTGAIAERARISNNGNVGIGTASPSQKLDVAGNIRIQGALFDSQNLQGAQGQVLTVNAGGNVEWQNPVSCVLGGADVQSNGTVNSKYGIVSGVTRTNKGRYTVNFSTSLTTGQYYAHLTKSESTSTRDDVNIDVSNYGTTSLNVIIHEGDNGTSANVYRDRAFSVTLFDATCTALSPLANSDRRLKTDIRKIDSREALEKVLRLQGVRYKWNTEKYPYRRVAGFDDKPEIGLIAQDVKEVVPEVVDVAGDGYYVLDYEKLVAVLVESIKEIWNRLTGIEEKIKKIDELEQRVKALEDALNRDRLQSNSFGSNNNKPILKDSSEREEISSNKQTLTASEEDVADELESGNGSAQIDNNEEIQLSSNKNPDLNQSSASVTEGISSNDDAESKNEDNGISLNEVLGQKDAVGSELESQEVKDTKDTKSNTSLDKDNNLETETSNTPLIQTNKQSDVDATTSGDSLSNSLNFSASQMSQINENDLLNESASDTGTVATSTDT